MTPLKTVFGCDLRTLAVYRVCLGLAFLLDLVLRARDLRVFFTHDGVLPRPDGTEPFLLEQALWIAGSLPFQIAIFLGAGLVGIALVLGFRTRLATFMGWGFLAFIDLHNNLVLNAGDVLLILLFFWSNFLPLGARFSVDAALSPQEPVSSNAYFSMGTVAILLQPACLYFFSAFHKAASADWIPDGTVLYWAFQSKFVTRSIGEYLLAFPGFLKGLTLYVWWLELIGPVLWFSPWWFLPLRLTLVVLFVFLHIGILALLSVGIFPIFNWVSLLPFIPSWCWDRFGPDLHTVERKGLTLLYDGACDFSRKIGLLAKTFFILPAMTLRPIQESPEMAKGIDSKTTWGVHDVQGRLHVGWDGVLMLMRHSPLVGGLVPLFACGPIVKIGKSLSGLFVRHRNFLNRVTAVILPYRQVGVFLPRWINWTVGLLALYMIFINIRTLPQLPHELSDPFVMVRKGLRLGQKWHVFRAGRRSHTWYVMPGRLIDGTDVDVFNFRMKAPELDHPSFEDSRYPNYRWRKYFTKLKKEKFRGYLEAYADYVCREWNAQHPPLQHLLWFQIFLFGLATPAPDSTDPPPKPTKSLFFDKSCLKQD